MTELAQKCRASWAKYAPDWDVREWSAESSGAFSDLPGYAFFMAALAAKKWAMASDWLRMAALYKYGGVYFDCDVELVASFGRAPAGEWIAGEWTASGTVWRNSGGGMALEKGSGVARHMLGAYEALVFDPRRAMMPWINAELALCAADVPTLPPEVFSPIRVDGSRDVTDRTIGIHHYAMGDCGVARRVLRWLSWHGMRPLVDAALKCRNRNAV